MQLPSVFFPSTVAHSAGVAHPGPDPGRTGHGDAAVPGTEPIRNSPSVAAAVDAASASAGAELVV